MQPDAPLGGVSARTPFMPVRNRVVGEPVTPRVSNERASFKGSMTPTAATFSTSTTSRDAGLGLGLGRPPPGSVVPLTTSALQRFAASSSNSASSSSASSSSMMSPLLGTAPSEASSTSAYSRTVNNKPPQQQTALPSSKRFTRPMAPASPEETLVAKTPGGRKVLGHMVSASDLRARARITSGSAPRKKPTVPGTANADPPSTAYTRPVTPGFDGGVRRARSNSRPPVPTPSTLSRPASRAGGDRDRETPYARPQSRMDEYGPESIIRSDAASADSDNEDVAGQLNSALSKLHVAATPGHSRTASTATVVASRQESVCVCVRVRPPAVGVAVAASGHVNPAHLELAWNANSDNGTIVPLDRPSNEYQFGTFCSAVL